VFNVDQDAYSVDSIEKSEPTKTKMEVENAEKKRQSDTRKEDIDKAEQHKSEVCKQRISIGMDSLINLATNMGSIMQTLCTLVNGHNEANVHNAFEQRLGGVEDAVEERVGRILTRMDNVSNALDDVNSSLGQIMNFLKEQRK
jgi:hypothetical protein